VLACLPFALAVALYLDRGALHAMFIPAPSRLALGAAPAGSSGGAGATGVGRTLLVGVSWVALWCLLAAVSARAELLAGLLTLALTGAFWVVSAYRGILDENAAILEAAPAVPPPRRSSWFRFAANSVGLLFTVALVAHVMCCAVVMALAAARAFVASPLAFTTTA
jgi:hypothetical protein